MGSSTFDGGSAVCRGLVLFLVFEYQRMQLMGTQLGALERRRARSDCRQVSISEVANNNGGSQVECGQ